MLFRTVLKVFHVNYPYALTGTPRFLSLGEVFSILPLHPSQNREGRLDNPKERGG